MADAVPQFVQPEGLALGIIVVSLIFLILSLISVGIRVYVRQDEETLGFDDWLMVGGTTCYIGATGLACWAASMGVGTKNEELNPYLLVEGQKAFTIWILQYVVCLALIKSSICVTLLRIAKTKRGMEIALWCLLCVVWASFFVTFIGVLLFCRPVQASWDTSLVLAGKATCATMNVMIGLSHTATVSTLVTDIGCTVLPGVLLWSTQMKSRAKLRVFGMLVVASIASVATIARAPFISHYSNPTDNLLFWVGFIVLFSNVELGIGCIASSLPSIRHLFNQVTGRETSQKSTGYNSSGANGSAGARSRQFHNPTDAGQTHATVRVSGGDWVRLHDGDSDKGTLLPGKGVQNKQSMGGIRMDYTYAVESVELEPVPKDA